MSDDSHRMRERIIMKNLDNIETELNKGKIGDYSCLEKIIKNIRIKIEETEKEIKAYNIEETTIDSIKNKNFNSKNCTKKLENYKKQFLELEAKLKKINEDDIEKIDQDDERAKSIHYNSFKKIQYATRATIEMENMSGNILNNLNNQSSQMKGVTNKINLTNNDLDTSSGIVTKMIGNVNRDKRIIIIFGLILSIIIIGLFIYKLINKFR